MLFYINVDFSRLNPALSDGLTQQLQNLITVQHNFDTK